LSPSMLQVAVPAGASEGWVDLEFRNEDTFRSTRLPSGFRYAPRIAPSIESVSPSPAMPGLALWVTGSGFIDGGTQVRLAGRPRGADERGVESCPSLWLQVPQDLDGMVLLEVATPLGSATANVWVSQPPSGAALAACQLGTYEATPGHLVDELYGRRWREP